MQTLIVTDEPESWDFLTPFAEVVHAADYLGFGEYHLSKTMRILNLCRTYDYQSIGYYVSLLAQARDHQAIPSVIGIQDVQSSELSRVISQDIEEEIQHSLQDIKGTSFTLSVYFGTNMAKRHTMLAKKLHGLFPLPLLRFTLEKKKRWLVKKLEVISKNDVPAQHTEFMQQAALNYLSKKRFYPVRKKQRYHDLAILTDPTEKNAPSNAKALSLFVKAGESVGLNVDLIDKSDAKSIAEYDAIFIRATTAVDHYTYRFARRAAQENMVVIDDPQSIVRCTNKVYLAELLRSHQIPTPDTIFISKFHEHLPEINFPCVIKRPDSAFSQGVVKLYDQKELQKSVREFFRSYDLILVQPFIPTEFDWRIGIIDHRAIFACRYYMAKGHWQIYNWQSAQEREGLIETVPISEVPEGVLKTALKATRLIGDGLYGVDIKTYQNQHFVIEINDNPSIDGNIEDQIMGEALYQQIMMVFLERIRRKHGYV